MRSTLAQMQLGYAQAVHLAGEAPATRPQDSDATVAGETGVQPESAAAGPAAGAPAESEPAAEKPAARPAAKKAAAKKPAAKKPAAKKPAVKKTAPKKPAAKKPRGGATPPAG